MDFSIVRKERIVKLQKKLERIQNALTHYRYTNSRDILEDLAAFEKTEKEIQIQDCYRKIEYREYLENL